MADAAGFVLAGGRSSRLGRDKALIPLAGRPLIEYALAVLCNAGIDNISILGDRPDLASFAAVIPDAHSGLGPLEGICCALAATSTEFAVVLSVDMPLLPSTLIEYMLRHARASAAFVTLVSVNGFPQTFPCVLQTATLPVLQQEMLAGRAGCFSAFKVAAQQAAQDISILPVELLARDRHVIHPANLPAPDWFLNINTGQDLATAERCITAPIA